MLKRFKLFLFLIFTLLFLVNNTNAELNTRISFYKINNSGDFISQNINNIVLTYYLTSGEQISKPYDTQANFNPEKELFCWSECNIVPNRYISKIDIRNKTELLSRQIIHINNENIDQRISIFLDKKINQLETVREHNMDINIESELLSDNDLIIEYNGILNIAKEGNYTFLVNVTGGFEVFIDNNQISSDTNNKTFSITLNQKYCYLKISYWSDKESKPNLFWKLGNEFELVTKENLIFVNGSIKNKSQIKQNKRELSNFPESYTPDYSAYPSYALYNHSITNGRIPLLLVHGLHGTYPYWNDIPAQLTDLDNDVWEVYYSPANSSNFLNAGLLKNAIDEVLQNYSSSKIDVISHSMGGFVTLGYIQSIGHDSNGNIIPYGENIRKYIPIAAPFHGSYLGNRVLRGESAGLICGLFIDPDDPMAQAYMDLAVGGEFNWFFNKNETNNEIEYLTLVGNKGIACLPDETKEDNSGEPDDSNDGFVAVSSAGLLDKGVPLIVLDDYNHANEIGDSAIPGFSFNAQREVNIINSFIKGDDAETLKARLGQDDHYIDPNDDSTNPYLKGSVVLKFTRDNYIDSVGLKNINTNEYYNLTIFEDKIHNTSTHNWFYFSSNDINMGYSNQKYGLTFPAGAYELYVNDIKENNSIKVKPAQTTMQLIDLDYDGDKINDSVDACYTEGYTNIPENNSYVSYYLDEDGCHAGILIRNLSNWKTYNKDNQLSSIQTGTSAFDIGHTNKAISNGTNYQPLSADIDADLDNEIIIFSNDYLMIFDANLTLINEQQIGTLRGQPDIINYDNDSFLEIIAVLQNNNSDNYTVIEYNGTAFNIEQSFDITEQGGHQNIKCLNFDDDAEIECIFKDYNGYLHSYDINSNDDSLDYKIGSGISSNNPIPSFADFDSDGDLDLLIEHNYMIALIDKNRNLKNISIADEYESIQELGGIWVRFCSNKKNHLRFANLTGNLSIIWAGGCDEKERTEKRKSKIIVLNNDLTKRFIKQCYWSSFDCVYVSRAYTHACKYNDPLIYDYNNDGFDEIIITHERNSQTVDNDELGIEIEVFNSSGDLVYVNEVSGPEFEYGSTCDSLGLEGASYADMDNNNKLDIITTKGIFSLNLTNITGDFKLDAQQPIPIDLTQNGLLDLIWSNSIQSKIFISDIRPSCNDNIMNQDEIDIDCGGVCGECPDSDNDGIADIYDKLLGNSSEISSNLGSITVFIGGSENITQRFNSNQLIEFKQDNKSIVFFNFDFSSKNLNLSEIVINKQTDNKTGYILVKGVNSTGTKTFYLDNLNTTIRTICIKDAQIDSISEISLYCNETNEFLIKCDSEEHFGYNCSTSSSQYKITGLTHSGAIQQQDTTIPSFTEIRLNNSNAKINEIVRWNSTLTDNLELSNAWFSANDSNQWINYSPIYTNGTSFEIDFNETINSSRGTYVCGMFYMNDSAGNLGETNKSCFFIANTAPVLNNINNIVVAETDIIIITANATDADNDNLIFFINDSRFIITQSNFSWVTGYSDAGFYSIEITVSDNYDNDSTILYVNITNTEEPISLESASSESGSTYSSNGIFLREEEPAENKTYEKKEKNSAGNSEESDKGKKEAVNPNSISKKGTPNKITGNSIIIPEKPSKPIGLTITFSIILFGLIIYRNIKNKR